MQTPLCTPAFFRMVYGAFNGIAGNTPLRVLVDIKIWTFSTRQVGGNERNQNNCPVPVMQYTRLSAIHRHHTTFNAVQCRSMPFDDILLHVCCFMLWDGRTAADSYLIVIFVKIHIRLCFYKLAYIDRLEISRLEFLGLVPPF